MRFILSFAFFVIIAINISLVMAQPPATSQTPEQLSELGQQKFANDDVLIWAKDTIIQILSMPLADMKSQEKVDQYFSKAGWESFQNSLSKSVEGLPYKAGEWKDAFPVLVQKGVFNGIYRWVLVMNRFTSNANGEEIRESIQFVVERATLQKSSRGLAISQLMRRVNVVKHTPVQCRQALNGIKYNGFLRDVKAINIYMNPYEGYGSYLKCLKDVKACEAENGISFLSKVRESLEGYPKPLTQENLAEIAREVFNKKWAHILPNNDSGKCTEVTVLQDDKTIDQRKGEVTYILRVKIIDDSIPKMALLYGTYFRPDNTPLSHNDLYSDIQVIRFDLRDDLMLSKIKGFLSSAANRLGAGMGDKEFRPRNSDTPIPAHR